MAVGERGLVQPAVKCSGGLPSRPFNGPAPGEPERLRRLGHKRSLGLRQLALGVEALERFVRREPSRRVHECCVAILALGCEPAGPRR